MDLENLIGGTRDGHSRRVSEISGLLAEKAGYPMAEIELIKQAALLHDTGKDDIAEHLINKPSRLTPDEYDIVKSHTTIGYKQLNEAARILALAAVVARQHHEHADGYGYPDGITGSEMHPYSKIIAVADVFDALYSRRPYKEPWDIERIRAYFTEQAGEQFDREAAMLLLSIIADVQAVY
jgi:putative nucleotidyltransferase with HDIG domain